MNAENIAKALKCCYPPEGANTCEGCPYDGIEDPSCTERRRCEMREIRFRGKSVDIGEWFCGDLLQYAGTAQIWVQTDDGKWNKMVDLSTVGQYTGLKDKNGTEIYEGDIVKANMDFGPGGMAEQTTSIYWDENVGGWQFNYFDKSTIEIIGNIHDNPELIGGAE